MMMRERERKKITITKEQQYKKLAFYGLFEASKKVCYHGALALVWQVSRCERKAKER